LQTCEVVFRLNIYKPLKHLVHIASYVMAITAGGQ